MPGQWDEVDRIFRQMHPDHEAKMASARAERLKQIDERLLTADPLDVVPPKSEFPNEDAWHCCIEAVSRSQIDHKAQAAGTTGDTLEVMQAMTCKTIRAQIKLFKRPIPKP